MGARAAGKWSPTGNFTVTFQMLETISSWFIIFSFFPKKYTILKLSLEKTKRNLDTACTQSWAARALHGRVLSAARSLQPSFFGLYQFSFAYFFFLVDVVHKGWSCDWFCVLGSGIPFSSVFQPSEAWRLNFLIYVVNLDESWTYMSQGDILLSL